MSHHNNQEFPGVLLDEMDRILVQIRQINDQAEALISRARDIAALAKRTVRENVKVHLESMKAEDRIRQADQVIEREAQREVERREQAIDDGRIGPGVLRRVVTMDPPAGTMFEAPPPQLSGGIVLPLSMPAEERAAIIQDIAELSGDGDAARDIVRKIAEPDADEDLARGPIVAGVIDAAVVDEAAAKSVGLTLEQAAVEFVRGTIAAQTQIEESLPGQAEGVNTGAAEELSPQPAEAAPVNEQVSAEMKGPAEAAAEEAKVIPPEGSSAVIAPASERLGRVPQPAADEAPRLNPSMIDIAARARQNANAREAAEFSETVLDLWSTTLLTESQIAKRLATGKNLIVTVLEQARAEQDPRVTGKRMDTKPKPKEHMPLSAIARKIMDRPAPVAAARAGVELGDFEPPKATAENLVSTGVCVVDLSRNKIFGKKGVWTTDSSRARTIANLNNGQMYPKLVLAQRCGWRDERELTDAITPMMERLRDIGIIMTSLPTGIVIRVAD